MIWASISRLLYGRIGVLLCLALSANNVRREQMKMGCIDDHFEA